VIFQVIRCQQTASGDYECGLLLMSEQHDLERIFAIFVDHCA
jgi:hypothetical protein